ncbi:uncharacterized protein LOC133470921 [Phyllopteryx taeniolatus]|uniref:uncharacterized protein LOC133470921 n=1 Tax=Phyllopteryx taeniolatus TaxID=161469 RepID=UPI002AD287A6|nr:uncharacterized protein LOC133470921 [Phyllopteryx taeniolatus]
MSIEVPQQNDGVHTGSALQHPLQGLCTLNCCMVHRHLNLNINSKMDELHLLIKTSAVPPPCALRRLGFVTLYPMAASCFPASIFTGQTATWNHRGKQKAAGYASITVETFKFLGITVSQDLKWATNINSVLKKAQQRMYFLQLLRKHGLPQELLRHFYTAVIESVLCSSITVWFGAATEKDKVRLQRTIKTAERIVGTPLPTLEDLHAARTKRRTCKILLDPRPRQERAKSSQTLHIPVTSSSGSFPQSGSNYRRPIPRVFFGHPWQIKMILTVIAAIRLSPFVYGATNCEELCPNMKPAVVSLVKNASRRRYEEGQAPVPKLSKV